MKGSSMNLKVTLAGFLAGLLFGVGLLVSGMANPAKVLNFLDVFGEWDPSLALVMGGAVAVTIVGFPMVRKRKEPFLLPSFSLPDRKDIDQPLIIGALLFGVGWGLGGYCPGPAWTSLSSFHSSSLVFIASMLLGMWLALWWKSRNNARPSLDQATPGEI